MVKLEISTANELYGGGDFQVTLPKIGNPQGRKLIGLSDAREKA